ncbi:phosphatidylinositol N-acetylglucosaminyltransferase [Martiniozyma asiatica (nom. inval.)]|nr:phosphatidylinositol N-acetylglucosaminyltransferase [Martiniozyma asiatica]
MEETPWKKLLWYPQPHPDNYTPKSFLSQLKRNSTVVKYSYRKLCHDFSLLILHLSLIQAIIITFYGIYQLNWNPIKPTIVTSSLTIIGFIIYVVTLKIRRNKELIELQRAEINKLSKNKFNYKSDYEYNFNNLESYLIELRAPSVLRTFKSSLLIIFYLLTLSPVLKSLTNSTSSDSIWALSAWLCLLNVLFNDFKIDFSQELKSHSSNLSKNICVSNAIVLASRLQSNLSAFCFILFAIQVGGLFPEFNNFTRRVGFKSFHIFQLISIVGLVLYALYFLFGGKWFLVCFTIEFIVGVGGPWWFMKLQKYKEELQGPWDPAVAVVNAR